MSTPVCTCGPGVWTTCDRCGDDAWCSHHCDFPCDDVTCEGGMVCTGCLTGRTCTAGTAGDGFRIPPPREAPVRECDDPAEPGARIRRP